MRQTKAERRLTRRDGRFHGWRQAWQRLLAGRDRVRRRALRRWQRELYLHRVVFAMSTLARRQVMLKAFLDWTTAWQGERRRSATVQAAATWRGRRCLFNVVRVAWPRFVQRMQRRRGRLFLADEHRRRQWWDRWANAFRRGRPHGRRHGAGRDKENVAAEPAHASSSKPPKRHPSAPLCPRVATVNVVAPEVILVGKDAEADVLDKSVIEFVGIEDDRAERGAPVQAVDDAQPSSMEAALDEAMLLAAEHARLAVERRHHLVWVAVCQRARQGRIRRAIHEQGTTLACFRAWRAALHLCREASNLFETFQVRRTRHLLRSWLRQVDVRRALLVIRRRIAIRAWRKARLHRQRLRRRALATWRAWAFPRRRTRRMRRLRLGQRGPGADPDLRTERLPQVAGSGTPGSAPVPYDDSGCTGRWCGGQAPTSDVVQRQRRATARPTIAIGSVPLVPYSGSGYARVRLFVLLDNGAASATGSIWQQGSPRHRCTVVRRAASSQCGASQDAPMATCDGGVAD